MNKKIDFFAPPIIAVVIILFLIAGYIGSFNYRFEDPLDLEVISTILYATIIFLIGVAFIKYGLKYDSNYKSQISEKINSIFSEKVLIAIVSIAIILQTINLLTLGGIPLFDSILKSNATTNLWRISYVLFLPAVNILLAKHFKKRYLLFVVIGAVLYGLNGYRTSLLAILASTFITLFYIGKINKTIGIIFIAAIIIGGVGIGYIASQSIANQHWMLDPIELVFYRCGFTLEVFERILPLGGTTDGHILSMIFSTGSPRTFIGNYVLHDNVCLTSTLFGPVYLDFGLLGLTIQMLFLGLFIKLVHTIAINKKGLAIGIYSIIIAHTLIWIETGPTDIMIWLFYLLAALLIILNYKNLKKRKN